MKIKAEGKAKTLTDCLNKLSEELRSRVSVKEKRKAEVGVSFEPRTQITYELRIFNSKKPIGTYTHTRVFEKDGRTMVAEFGKYKLDFNLEAIN